MGRLIYSLSVSLDGFADSAEGSLDWVQIDEEVHAAFNDMSRQVTTTFYGRRMYELMSDYWPTADSDPDATPAMIDFARIWRDTPKVVFSSTLTSVDWSSRLVTTDAVAEVARLKAESGFVGDVSGPTLAASLLAAGLIDEVILFVTPVILGGGLPFFPPLADRIRLELLETRTFGSGVVMLRYATRAT